MKEMRGLQTGWIELGLSRNPILIMLHGYPDSPLVWEFQTRFFSDRFQVVCPFVRGAGPSKPTADVRRNGLACQSLDLLQMIREVDPTGSRSIYLVGHDLGAVHAWNLAPYLGSRLKRMVIFNGLHLIQYLRRLKRPEQHLRSWYIYGMQLPWLPEMIARRFPTQIASMAYRLGRLPRDRRPQLSNDSTACVVSPLKQYRAFVREVPQVLRKSRRLAERPIAAPVLVIWGARDPFIEKISASEFESIATDVTFRIVPRGHWHFRENPDETNRMLADFFGMEFFGTAPIGTQSAGATDA